MTYSLTNIADITVGYQAKTRVQPSDDRLFHLIQGNDFNRFNILKKEKLTPFVPERKVAPYLVRKDDILFQARGTDHFACRIDVELTNTLASSSFYIIRLTSEKIIPAYLAWWLNQKTAQAYFKIHAGSSMISFISKKTLSQLELKIPSLNTQKKICSTIALLAKENQLLQALAKKRSQLTHKLCLNASQKLGEI